MTGPLLTLSQLQPPSLVALASQWHQQLSPWSFDDVCIRCNINSIWGCLCKTSSVCAFVSAYIYMQMTDCPLMEQTCWRLFLSVSAFMGAHNDSFAYSLSGTSKYFWVIPNGYPVLGKGTCPLLLRGYMGANVCHLACFPLSLFFLPLPARILWGLSRTDWYLVSLQNGAVHYWWCCTPPRINCPISGHEWWLWWATVFICAHMCLASLPLREPNQLGEAIGRHQSCF